MGIGIAKRHPVTTFFILTYVITWGAALVLQVIALRAGLPSFAALINMAETTGDLGTLAGQLAVPISVVYLFTRIVDFGPSLAGLLTPVLLGVPEILLLGLLVIRHVELLAVTKEFYAPIGVNSVQRIVRHSVAGEILQIGDAI